MLISVCSSCRDMPLPAPSKLQFYSVQSCSHFPPPFPPLETQIPHSLYRQEGYDHREALFGMPSYGGSIAQNVYYSQSTLCDPIVDPTSGVPAREKDSNGKMKPWPSPYILMIDRGDCTFVQKVWLLNYLCVKSTESIRLSTEPINCTFLTRSLALCVVASG